MRVTHASFAIVHFFGTSVQCTIKSRLVFVSITAGDASNKHYCQTENCVWTSVFYLYWLALISTFLFRKCGKAVCASCSTKTSPLPLKGHEFAVRVCEDCFIKITDDE